MFRSEDAPQLKTWSQDFAEMLGNFQHNPERVPRVRRSVEEMTNYFHSAIQEIRRHPREGLIHSFLTAEVDGDRFTDEEVVANTISHHGWRSGDDDESDRQRYAHSAASIHRSSNA